MKADSKSLRRDPVRKLTLTPPQRTSQHNPNRADARLKRWSWERPEDTSRAGAPR